MSLDMFVFFFFQAEDGIRDYKVTGVQTCALPISVSATFSDPGVSDGPWAYAVAWGDGLPATTGSTTSQTNPITATHTYALPGTYTVSVTVTDKDGAAGSGQLTVTVGTAPNRPPTAAAGGPYAGAEGAAGTFD